MSYSDKRSKFIATDYNICNLFMTVFPDNKVIEIYCLADDICRLFDFLSER